MTHLGSQLFDRAQCFDRFVSLPLRGAGQCIDTFGRRTDLFHQLREPLNHEVERVGHVPEHVCCHLTTFSQVSLTDVRHQNEEDHQPLLQLVALTFRLLEGRRNIVQHGIERCGQLSDFVFRLDLGTDFIVTAGGHLGDSRDMDQILRKEIDDPICDTNSEDHRDESAEDKDHCSDKAGTLRIVVEILRHFFHVQYLFTIKFDDLLECRLQVHRQGQDPEVPQVLSLCRVLRLPETIGQRTQRSIGRLEILRDGRLQNRQVFCLVTTRS